MAIWKRETDLDALNAIGENSLVAHIGIRFTAIGDDYLEAVMPVDARTHQPFGLLHGGASVVLAESMGSIAGYLCTEEGKSVVGIEVNASHHRSVSSGEVRGTCRRCISAHAIRCGRLKSATRAASSAARRA